MSEAKSFKCEGCGAPLEIPKNARGVVKCQHCGRETMIQGATSNAEIAAKENISSGFEFSAQNSTLHRTIVNTLASSPYVPLDVFTSTEVTTEEKHCIPAYSFYCNAMASFTYEVGNERTRQVIEGRGDTLRTRDVTEIEWSGASSNASISAHIAASGVRKFSTQVKSLYATYNTGQLIDIEHLTYPPDVITSTFDYPEQAAFIEQITPMVNERLESQALNSISNLNTRNVVMAGANISKEQTRIYLSMYHILYKYNNKNYDLWVRGDGTTATYNEMPVDMERKALYDDLNQKLSALPSVGSGSFVGLLVGSVIGAIIFFESAFLLIICILLAAFSVFMIVKKRREKQIIDGQRASLQNSLQAFTNEQQAVVNNFRTQKKALRGIYDDVSGDPNAF